MAPEVVRPSVRLSDDGNYPTECLCGCSSLGEADLRQTQSCDPVVLQTGGSYPSTAQPLGQTTCPRSRYPDWNSPLAESVPTLKRHGCADSDSALALLQLRKIPADKSVTSERAEKYEISRSAPLKLSALVEVLDVSDASGGVLRRNFFSAIEVPA